MILKSPRSSTRLVSVLATMILPLALQANPKGGEVKAGSASFEGGPNSLTIRQSSDRGIIHWQDFSIGAGESTKFVQPNSNSATLNRVVGGLSSTIQGSLEANGKIYLINPNGILVGPTGRINTASFVASTLDVPDAEFLAGSNMHFKGSTTAGVVNLGTITATNGDVVLLGHTVHNGGTINAPNGVVALGAGDDIVLQVAGDERIVVNSGIATGGTGVTNSGTIRAAQAELKAAGGNVYALAVNNTGIVCATGITQRNGRIILGAAGGVVQNTGHLIARNANGSGGHVRMVSGQGGHTIQNGVIDAVGVAGQNGGTIELLGDDVHVGANSLMNVSGANAGLISIGVDAATASLATPDKGIDSVLDEKRASDPAALTTAQRTVIEAGSRIFADAAGAGHGGHVVIWSEQQSVVGGVVEAKGGALGGDGGFVETSGHLGLSITTGTKVIASAAKGSAGTWLMDPAGISIDAGPTDANAGTFASPPETDYNQSAATNHVAASDIVAALSAGSFVKVITSNSFANRDLDVNAAIATGVLAVNPTTHLAPTLTLIANAGNVNINAAIGGAGTNLIFNAQSHGGDLTVASTGSVVASGISLSATATMTIAGTVSALNDKTISMNAANVAFTGTGQAQTTANASVFIQTSGTTAGTVTDAGATSIIAGGLGINAGALGVGTSANPLHISVTNFDAIVNDEGLTTGTGGGVFVSNSGGDLHIGGSDPHHFSGTTFGGISVPNIAGFGGIEVNSTAGNLFVDALVDTLTAYGDIKLTAGLTKSVEITTVDPNTVRSYHGNVELHGGGDVFVGDGVNAGVNVRAASGLTVTAGNRFIVSGSIVKAGGGSGLSVTSGGDITIQQASGSDARLGTSGNVEADLTTGAGHSINIGGGSTGGVSTVLADDVTGNADTSGGSIFLKTDGLVISSQLNGGVHGSVNITPVSAHTAINLGTTAKGVAGELGVSNAEMSRISGGNVDFYTSSTNDGVVHVTGALNSVSNNIGQLTLEADGGGGVNISQAIDMDSTDLQLIAQNNGSITGQGNLNLDHLIITAPSGGMIYSGAITASSVTFHTQSTLQLSNHANQIDEIMASSTGSQGVTINNATEIAIAGAVTSTGQFLISTASHLDIMSAGSITAPSIVLDISHGNLANLATLNPLHGSFTIYLNQLGSSEKGSITGTDYTTAPVVPFNNPASPASNIFYYRNLTAPPSGSTTSPSSSSSARLFAAPVPAPSTTSESAKDFRQRIADLPLNELAVLANDPVVKADAAKLFFLQELISYQENIAGLTNFNTNEGGYESHLEATLATAKQNSADAIETQKRAVLTSILYPTVLDMSDPAVAGAFYGTSLMAANVNLKSFSIDQLSHMTRDEILSMLGSAGVKLSAADQKVAANATMTVAQLSAIIQLGDGLTPSQFSGLVAAGGGNLTVNQIVAAGGQNLISQDGGGIVSHDSGGFSVVDGSGKVVSNDGGSMTVFALAQIISHDSGGIISHDSGGIISHDSGGIVSHDSGGLTMAVASLISQDGGGILAARNALISQDGGGIISHDSGGIISHDSGGLLPNGAGFSATLMNNR